MMRAKAWVMRAMASGVRATGAAEDGACAARPEEAGASGVLAAAWDGGAALLTGAYNHGGRSLGKTYSSYF